MAENVRRGGRPSRNGKLPSQRVDPEAPSESVNPARGDHRDCAQWANSLRGLAANLEKPDKRETITNSIGMGPGSDTGERVYDGQPQT